MTALLRIEEAADRLGVPKAGLMRAAEEHGFLIRLGRAVRIREDELQELLDRCRDKPKAPASTNASAPAAHRRGSSSTQAESKSQPALEAAARLKSRSRNTSPGEIGQLVRLRQKR